MKKRMTFAIVLLLLTTACSQEKEHGKHSLIDNNIDLKTNSDAFFHDIQGKWSYITDSYFVSAEDWLSNEELIYISNNGVHNLLIKFNLFTGEQTILYETNEIIMQVHPNINGSLIAIETKDTQNNSSVTILNETGNVVHEEMRTVDLLEFSWSPYEQNKLLITSYYPNFTTKVELIDLEQKINETLPINPYVQWYNEKQISFFNWDNNTTTLEAPINFYNVTTGAIEETTKQALLFSSISGYFMYVEESDENLIFHFLNSTNNDEINSLSIPMLNSHAGYVWTPFFDWVETKNILYTFEPLEKDSVIDYNAGYNLIAYQADTGQKKKVSNINDISKIKCSPNGEMCLIGERLDTVISTLTGSEMTLLKEKE